MTVALTPEPVSAVAVRHGRFGCSFTPRFFVALALGLIWLIPAWWTPRLLALLFIWDALVLLAWLWDLLTLPRPSHLRATRLWTAPLALGRPASVQIELQQSGRLPLRVFVVDELAPALRHTVPQSQLSLPPAGSAAAEYQVMPSRRGDAAVGSLYLRYRSFFFSFAERWARVPLAQTVCVLPDAAEAYGRAMHLMRSRQLALQKRRQRQLGLGREFESLRDYRPGDEIRDVCWSATARRATLVTRTFEAERSQTVWIVIDCGRLLRAEIATAAHPFRLSKLDYSVAAALSLAQAASLYGDRTGALAYGRTIQQLIPADRGPRQIRRWIEALAHARAESTEANHSMAARLLLSKQTRRALVVWITDFAETPTTPDVVEYAYVLAKRHLVLFAAVSQPDLALAAQAVPSSEREMFRGAAALALVERREVLIRSLRQGGVLATEVSPGTLTTHLINEYLAIKDRGSL